LQGKLFRSGQTISCFYEANTDDHNRNRNGLNDWIHEKYQREQAAEKSDGGKANT